MDAVRYYVALLLVVFTPPAFMYWLSIHPFIRFWRRVGARTTLAVNYAWIIAVAGLLYLARRPLLSVQFGTNVLLIVPGVLLIAASAVMRRRIARRLPFSTLTGIPEIDPAVRPTPLLTEGIYGRIRHPRYVQAWTGVAGWALLSNYLAAYVVLALLLVFLPLLVLLEERELRVRFGSEYEEYAARVPRFIPTFRRR